jgi:hypothetical protein
VHTGAAPAGKAHEMRLEMRKNAAAQHFIMLAASCATSQNKVNRVYPALTTEPEARWWL